jgi:myosin V
MWYSCLPLYQDMDVGLVLKLQQKVKELERDRMRMHKRLEELDKEESPSEDLARTQDMFKVCSNIIILHY